MAAVLHQLLHVHFRFGSIQVMEPSLKHFRSSLFESVRIQVQL